VLAKRLADAGVDTRPFFYPLSSIPAYAERPEARKARERNVVSYRVAPYGVNLPSSAALTRGQVSRVADAFLSALGE
jgi:perosamine synthetase